MKLQCLLNREGGTHVTFGEGADAVTYHFSPDDKGRHVAEVDDDDHADQLLNHVRSGNGDAVYVEVPAERTPRGKGARGKAITDENSDFDPSTTDENAEK